ncbi:MAG: hypothetical protein K6G33_04070 [Ruminococcus sp.]|uniref:hypothetical protein n=1 Tax=Ruminococcus sp. TaxID=41978 RepID=UPI0025D9EF1A|nr:hypothetical protein [Ruminococcus sp.]MCR5599904.1 hypothetical protein [Ruminococcus sp.]
MKNKKARIISSAVNILSFGMLGAYLVYMLMMYKDFPEQIGVHYGEDNEFDVYTSKWLAFFPFMAGFVLAVVFTVGSIAVKNVKSISKKLCDEDYIFVRKTLLMAFDAMKLLWSVFYTIWAHCVIHQTKMFTFGIPIRIFQVLPILIIAGALIAIDSRVRLKKSNCYIIIAELVFISVMVFILIISNNLRK